MLCHCHGQRQPACFKTSRRIRALFFYKDIWIPLAANYGRPSFAQRHRRDLRQHRPVPPHPCPATRERRSPDRRIFRIPPPPPPLPPNLPPPLVTPHPTPAISPAHHPPP